jgi:aspartate/methionine/tyrosine aminotransferase
VIVNSFSKYFSMTGWRLGWLLLPPRLLRAADCLAGNFTVCPPALAQRAALGAFAGSSYAEADSHVARYAVNRRLLLDGLARLGITRLAPADGAFYVYADVAHLTADSMDLTYRLLADIGLAVAPGLDFDPVEGHRWIRFSCAGATEHIQEALVRLEGWLHNQRVALS